MDTQDFLRRVLGDKGHYCVFAAKDGSRKQKFCDNIGAVVTTAGQLDAKGNDTYFALATFKVAGSREAHNALQMRAFFLDLDCGPGKDYPDQVTAIRAAKNFVLQNHLPKPIMVNSGRGVHIYWALTEPVPVQTWQPAAERLKKFCKAKGLRTDPAVTADAARVLRVPSTHNYKDNPPKTVQVMSDHPPVVFDALVALLPELPAAPIVPSSLLEMDSALMQRLMGNRASSFKKIMQRINAGTGCAQLAYAIGNQADVAEPMWRGALSIAQHCEERERAIRSVSDKHPQYDEDEAFAKAQRIKGPYRCETFEEYNPGGCEGCPLRGKIKSPIQLGSHVLEAPVHEDGHYITEPNDAGPDDEEQVSSSEVSSSTQTSYTIPVFPEPFFRGKNGGVYRRAHTEEEEPLHVYHNDIYVIRRVVDPDTGEGLVWRLHLPKDGVREFAIPLSAVTSREDFRRELATVGVPLYGKRLENLMDYAAAWVNELQEVSEADTATRQFGWADDEMKGFILGDKHITANTVEFNPMSSSTGGYFGSFKQRGTLDGWKQMMRFYEREGMEMHHFMLGLTAGAPLMALFPSIHGMIFNVFSDDSGFGKTTTMKAGLAIWGNPDDLLSHNTDTLNARMNRAEIFRNLPMCMDELTNAEGGALSDFAYSVSNGRQKNRMSSGNNKERYRGLPWNTTFISTANASLMDKIAAVKMSPRAEAQRIMEYEAKRVLFETKAETDAFSNKIMMHFGHVGVPLIQYIMNDFDAVRKLLEDTQSEIDLRAGLTAQNRFYSIYAAVGVMGIVLLRAVTGVKISNKKLKEWIITDLLPRNLNGLRDLSHTTEAVINDYINENYGAVLRIKSTDTAGGTVGSGLDQLVVPDRQPNVKLVARYETDTNKLFLVPSPLKAWCARKQLNYAAFAKRMQEEYGAQLRKIRINKGTRFVMPPTDAWELDFHQREERDDA
jgi:hypothetical protein